MTKRVAILDDSASYAYYDDQLKQKHRVSFRGGKALRPGESPIHEVPDEALEKWDRDRYHQSRGHRRGVPIYLPEDEFEGWTSTEASAAQLTYSDEQLKQMTAEQLIALVNQTPSIAQRVIDVEQDRRYTRKAVVEHAQKVIDAQAGEDVSTDTGRPGRSQLESSSEADAQAAHPSTGLTASDA